jgi:hypothetical protein
MFQFVRQNPLCLYNNVLKTEHNTEELAVSPMKLQLELDTFGTDRPTPNSVRADPIM